MGIGSDGIRRVNIGVQVLYKTAVAVSGSGGANGEIPVLVVQASFC